MTDAPERSLRVEPLGPHHDRKACRRIDRERLLRRFASFGLPKASIPELYRPATVLASRNGALEIAVIQRMIFYFDRQSFIVRIERWAARHRPRFEDSIELETQVIMETRRRMFLNYETKLP